jgi:hypothetical protein
MKTIICWLKGHNWSDWLWAEDIDYACRRCHRCLLLEWGSTLEYERTFNKGYKITSRLELKEKQ